MEQVADFFRDPLVQGVFAAVGALGVLAWVALFPVRWVWRRGKPPTAAPRPPTPPGDDSLTVRASDRTVTLKNVHVGGDLNIYLNGLPQAEPEVRDPFEEGLRLQHAEQHEAAIAEFEKALARAENDSQRCALHILIGNSLMDTDRLAEAESHYRDGLHAARRANDRQGQAAALGSLGNVYGRRRQLAKAERHYKKVLSIHEELPNLASQANALGNLGNVYAQRGQLQEAEEHYSKACDIFEEIGDRLRQASALANLGNIYARGGDLGKARQYLDQALTLQQQIGERLAQANSLASLGLLHEVTGDVPLALDHLRRARDLFAQVGARGQLEKADELIAELEAVSPPKP